MIGLLTFFDAATRRYVNVPPAAMTPLTPTHTPTTLAGIRERHITIVLGYIAQ